MVTIGLVGCGSIGSQLAKAIQHQFQGKARLIGIYDQHPGQAKQLAHRLNPRVPILPVKKLVSKSDLVIEAASAHAVGELLPQVMARRKALLVMSAGGLLKHPKLLQRAIRSGTCVYLPSGALLGLDGIKAGAVGRLRSVTLTTRKPPKAFQGAPGVGKRRIRLDQIRGPRLLFQGSAAQAVAAFPQNINVAATLALAGIGPVRTRVRVIADPTIRKNIHEVEARGDFGRLWCRTENQPSRENPKTSQLAVLSAIATLKQILQPLKVGT